MMDSRFGIQLNSSVPQGHVVQAAPEQCHHLDSRSSSYWPTWIRQSLAFPLPSFCSHCGHPLWFASSLCQTHKQSAVLCTSTGRKFLPPSALLSQKENTVRSDNCTVGWKDAAPCRWLLRLSWMCGPVYQRWASGSGCLLLSLNTSTFNSILWDQLNQCKIVCYFQRFCLPAFIKARIRWETNFVICVACKIRSHLWIKYN